MGETLQPVTPRFNRSLRVECQEDRLTGEPGAVLLREILESSGIVDWMEPAPPARARPARRCPADHLSPSHDADTLHRRRRLLGHPLARDHGAAMGGRYVGAHAAADIAAGRPAHGRPERLRAHRGKTRQLAISHRSVPGDAPTRPTWPPVPCSGRTITPAQAPEAAAQTPPANKAG